MNQVPHLVQSGMWRWTKTTGLERFELLRTTSDWILQGTILTVSERGPTEARYEVVCDDAWRTKSAAISLRSGTDERSLQVVVAGGRWNQNGRENETIRDCVDIDLEWSPSTNTIPVRRLRLAVGQRSGVITAAWVRFPDLTLQPLRQEYERTSQQCLRYTSGEGAFAADVAVDAEGLVLDYEGFWQRILEAPRRLGAST